MMDLMLETKNGRIGPGPADKPLLSSEGKQWNGFFIREQGATDIEAQDVLLLKHVVCIQLSDTAQLDWSSEGKFVNKSILPGQISVLPANKLYSASYRHTGNHLTVLFDPTFLSSTLENGQTGEEIDLRWEFGIDSPALRELGLLLRDEARRLHTENPNYPVTIARLMAMHLVQHHAVRKTASARRGGLSPTRFSRVKELIQLRLGENLTLDEMARTAGLSVFHFSRVFRQTTGMSPFQYVTTCRINHAKQLLLHPFARIGDVALECGFCDQAHLTRQFKRFVGITPAAYVRSLGHRHLAR